MTISLSLTEELATKEASYVRLTVIKFNFSWSFVYNVLALLFASGALINARNGVAIRIPPQYASLSELVSVLPVIAIAVGLRLAKI
jgi:Cu2+-exporting ATPase